MPETILEMKKAHEIISEFQFETVPLERGYSNRYLRIDLTNGEIKILPVTDKMKQLWTGGKGFDLWLMLQEINKNTKWDSPENSICFSSGPLGGTSSFPGSGKTIVTAISPITHNVMDCNVGGYFGPYMKFSGFDAVVVLGKAQEESIILIDAVSGKISIEKAPMESVDSHILAEELTEMYADNDEDYRNIACVSAGRAAEHSRMGVLNFSFWDWRRKAPRLKQAGRGGVGTVLRNKKIKALVLKNKDYIPNWSVSENKVSHLTVPEKINSCKCENEIENIVKKWNYDPEYVIEMLQDIQDRFRFISKESLEEICKLTGTPKAYLFHIATFYKTFSLEEKGETTIQVCMGTSCHVKGAANVLDSFERELNIKTGDTTKDKKFTLEAVACVGACSIAPVVKVGEKVMGNVQAKDIKKIIKNAIQK